MTVRPAGEEGFTLIELLVVISIIGLLASVVLSAVNTARNKGRDAAIEEEAQQMETVMQQQFADTGSYAPLKASGSSFFGASCSPYSPTGAYAAQASQICTALTNLGDGCGSSCVYLASVNPYKPDCSGTSGDSNSEFSIMVYLPGATAAAGGASQYLCIGSSGQNSIGAEEPSGACGNWQGSGCKGNP